MSFSAETCSDVRAHTHCSASFDRIKSRRSRSIEYQRLDHEPRRRLRLRTEGAAAVFETIGRRGRPEFLTRAERMRACGNTFVELVAEYENRSARQVRRILRCNLRGCPNCDAMRSDRVGNDAVAMFEHHLRLNPTDRLIFLTVTQPNVPGPALRADIDLVLTGWHKFTRKKKVKTCVLGSMRSLEISYNPVRDDFHPHIHSILCVSSKYWPGDPQYIEQLEWAVLWQRSYGTDRRVIVWVEFIDTTMVDGHLSDQARAKILQCCKYIVKAGGVYAERTDGTYWADPDVVETLHDATYCRRQLAFSGCLLKARRELAQGDVDGETEDYQEIPDGYLSLRLETYRWFRRQAVADSWFDLVGTVELGCPARVDVDRIIAKALKGAPEVDTS